MAGEQLESVLQHIRNLVAVQTEDPLSDRDLLERFIRDRDEAAFAALVRRHGPMVLGVCRRVLRHAHDAEDACQASFLVLARKAAAIRKKESVGSFLHGVAYRVASRLHRDIARRQARETAVEDVPGPEPAEVTWREVRQVLDEELRRLPQRFQAPLLLCCLEGRTRDEAAAALGWTPGTLRGRLERGRELLRRRLARRGVTLSAAILGALLGRNATAALPATLLVRILRTAVTTAGPAAAGVIPTTVASLTEGVLKAMLMARVKLAAAVAVTIGLAGLGVVVLSNGRLPAQPPDARQPARPTRLPEAEKTPPAGIAFADADADTVPNPPDAAQLARNQAASRLNLKKLALAMHNYLDIYGHFPPPAIYSQGVGRGAAPGGGGGMAPAGPGGAPGMPGGGGPPGGGMAGFRPAGGMVGQPLAGGAGSMRPAGGQPGMPPGGMAGMRPPGGGSGQPPAGFQPPGGGSGRPPGGFQPPAPGAGGGQPPGGFQPPGGGSGQPPGGFRPPAGMAGGFDPFNPAGGSAPPGGMPGGPMGGSGGAGGPAMGGGMVAVPRGKALLSWRVALLPFLAENDLYKQFKLDEPWDSPHNLKLLKKMPAVYAAPGSGKADAGKTWYQVFVGEHAAFEKHRALRLADFLDGTSNTILIAEAGCPVPWTKPEDLHYARDEPLPGLGGLCPDVINVALAGGSVATLTKNGDPNTLRRAIERDDGNPIDWTAIQAPASPREAELRRQNERLHREVDRVRAQLEALRREREVLQEEDAESLHLRKENESLEKLLRQTREETERLRQEIERLKKDRNRPKDE